MRVQILMSVMNQVDHSIVIKSNISSDAIVINQSDKFSRETFIHKGYSVQFYTFDEKGVGLSRNSALDRADADIILFADDDLIYTNDYQAKILAAFKENPDADLIMFNVTSTNVKRPSADVLKPTRIRRHNSLKFGTYRVAARLNSIRIANLSFSLLFGGGAKYSSGEDSLFIFNALKKGLKIIALPITIATVSHGESTWFNGYTDKYFKDKGALFYALSSRLYILLILQYIIRKHRSEPKLLGKLRLMMLGARQYKAGL